VTGRLTTATALGFREQARRPLLIVLLVVLPFFFITRAIAATEEVPRSIGLPGGEHVMTTMRDIHGMLMAAITVAFLAGLCGVFAMRSAHGRSSAPEAGVHRKILSRLMVRDSPVVPNGPSTPTPPMTRGTRISPV